MVWEKIETSGVKPLPRSQHTAAFYNDCLFIFGGGNRNSLFNDLHVLDLSKWMILLSYIF